MATKVVSSAVIVSPPDDLWGPIQQIRQKHDKAYERWMPHINLIYPFYPKARFMEVLPKLREAMAQVTPFTVTLDSFDYFQHGASSATLFLHPTVQPPNALRDLQAALERVFPDCTEQSTKSEAGFHAHLTVGQFGGKTAAQNMKSDLTRDWKPIKWQVDHIQLISRTPTGPFRVVHTVPLGSIGGSQPAAKPQPGQLKRPHGESLARAPPEARRQIKAPVVDRSDEWGSYTWSVIPAANTQERPRMRRQPIAAPVQVAPVVTAPVITKPKTKKKKKLPKKTITTELNSFSGLTNGGTVCTFNHNVRRFKRDPLTCTFESVHTGYAYRKMPKAPKVIKPVELLSYYSNKHIKAMQSVMDELERLEAEECNDEKGKEKVDQKEAIELIEPDEEMQEIIKELVLDLSSLNSGRAVQLEAEFEAASSGFFVAPECLPSNIGHAAKPVFFNENGLNKQKNNKTQVFWDDSCVSAPDEPDVDSFGPARADPFFKIEGKPASQKKQSHKSIRGDLDEEQRELIELKRLLDDGFLTQEKYEERTNQIKESIRLRKALANKRKAELRRQELAEQKLWEERERKLMAEREVEEQKLNEEKKRQLSASVLRDFLDGRIGAKEVAQKIKSGIVTVDQLLGLWKTELRPLQLQDYYPLATYQPGPSKHSKIMADVLYLLSLSDPTKQTGNTLEPSALPQTPEVLHTVEKIAAHNPGLVRKFAHYIRSEREMRTEWQRDVQERLLAV